MRTALAFAVLAGWMGITVLSGALTHPGGGQVTDIVTGGVGWNFVAACLFLGGVAALVRASRWGRAWGPDLGLGAAAPRTLRLLWLPALYVLAMGAAAVALGLPPAGIVALVLLNMVLVGVSEELMFRGFLWAGLRERLGFWAAVWLSSVIFGGVHVLNAFTTGAFAGAALQAVAAFMSGVHFLALRLRCRSIWPGAGLHAVWNSAALLLVLAAMREGGGGPGGGAGPSIADMPPALLALPLLAVLPLFAYGLFLIRKGSALE